MNGVSDEKEHYTSNSPHIPREGLLQDDDEDDDQSYVDSDDEDDEITLEEIVTWVAETDNRITELDDKLQKTGHTKSGINRVLDELAKQYGLLEDMQVSFEFTFLLVDSFLIKILVFFQTTLLYPIATSNVNSYSINPYMQLLTILRLFQFSLTV